MTDESAFATGVQQPLPVDVPPQPPAAVESADDVLARLPARLARALSVPDLHQAVQDLLDTGWWPAHLAVRLSAAALDPDVVALRELLLVLAAEEVPERPQPRRRVQAGPRASDAVREHWIAEARRQLRSVPRTGRPAAVRTRPACAACGDEGAFFVTPQVRLCRRCTTGLATGELTLVHTDGSPVRGTGGSEPGDAGPAAASA